MHDSASRPEILVDAPAKRQAPAVFVEMIDVTFTRAPARRSSKPALRLTAAQEAYVEATRRGEGESRRGWVYSEGRECLESLKEARERGIRVR